MDSVTKRWIKSAADEYAVSQGCYFDERAADHVSEFFRRFLRHSKGAWAGKPFELLDWQRDDLIAPVYGWKQADGLRRIRKVYCEIAKKNGKSTIGAGIGLYGLAGDGEAGAEVYSAATDQQQASIVHNEAISMVDSSPELTSVLDINRSSKTISFPATKSVYKALSSEAGSKEGLNASTIIVDELHVWRGRALWDALKYAGRARSQPLLFVITTAGDDLLSVCYEQRQYAKDVLSGTIKDSRFWGLIYAADPQVDDWTDEATWFKANPSLGKTIRLEDFRADFQEASKAPSTQSSFKRYSLNIWATGSDPAIPKHVWDGCKREFTAEDFEGEPCVAGIDLSKSRDMTSVVLTFFRENKFYWLPYFWLPENTIQDRGNNEYFRVWKDMGVLRSTPGDVCDYNQIESEILDFNRQFDIRGVYYDSRYAEQLVQNLDNVHGIPRYPFGQSMPNFAGPTGELERLLLSQGLFHNDNPILTWQAGHVEFKTDNNGYKRPVKPSKDDPRKIDGIVAGIMSLAGAMELGLSEPTSVYDSGGVAVL